MDIGPTKPRLAVGDLRGEPLELRVVTTPTEREPADVLSQLAAELRRLLADARVPIGRLLAVAAGAPGVVDRHRGVLVAVSPHLDGWAPGAMAKILRPT